MKMGKKVYNIVMYSVKDFMTSSMTTQFRFIFNVS
jgi:hypothetical protein